MKMEKNMIQKISVFFLYLITLSVIVLGIFIFPSSTFAETQTLCRVCADYSGHEMCGYSHHGTTGCNTAAGYCQLTGVACNY